MRPRVSVAAVLLLVAACGPATRDGAERPSGVPERDFARAVELQREGEHLRSVPFFRAASAGRPELSGLHAELAKALNNATIQMSFSGRGVRFAVARSQDRARMRHESLAEIDRAIDLETGLRERAALWLIRSRVLEQCGYVADARVSIAQALELQPGDPILTSAAARLDARLRAAR